MAKLLISTQVYENYGYRWKPKGGNDYVILNHTENNEETTKLIMAIRHKVECDNNLFKEHIINWQIVDDNYITSFEQDQLDFEGAIRFPSQVITSE